ncbi:restriction endonuclease [Bacillus sp. AFS006103]|nr:restriction endonuclease [Bacillus sp. AFS006103]
MSKNVKKQKSIELLLEEVLVPEDEQPYEVPDNWVWTNLNSLSKLVVDGSHNPPPKQREGYPMLSGRNILDGNINFETDRYLSEENYQKEYKRTPIESDDVLLTIVGTIGRTTVVPKECSPFVLQRSVALIKPMINSKYLSYYFSSPVFQSYLQRNARGTAQKGVYLQTLKSSSVPLPPLLEQYRISEKLERLLNKIEEAKKLIEEAKEIFELRKVAIFDKAFRGELTEEWREKNLSSLPPALDESGDIIKEWKPIIKIPNTWVYKSINDICVKVTDGTHDTPKRTESGVPYITAKHIRDGIIDFDNCDYVSEEVHKVIYSRCNPEKNDILLVNIGAGAATPALIDVNFQFSLKNVALLKPDNSTIDSKYLEYYLRFVKLFLFTNITSGGSQPFLSLKKIKTIPIIVPSLQEQKVIVNKLDSIFSKEIETNIELEKLPTILNHNRASILSQAFRGELGTNDPGEESGIELLKEVLQEQVK